MKIEKDIPIPSTQASNMADTELYDTMKQLEVRDSFAIKLDDELRVDHPGVNRVKAGTIRMTVARYGERLKRRHTTRIIRQDGKTELRVWRTK